VRWVVKSRTDVLIVVGLGGHLLPEESRKGTSQARNKYLWKSMNTSTFTYTVSQSLSRVKKTSNVKPVVDSSTSTKRRDGGTGRRSGLKIRRCLAPWGFNSPSRHQPQSRVGRGSQPNYRREDLNRTNCREWACDAHVTGRAQSAAPCAVAHQSGSGIRKAKSISDRRRLTLPLDFGIAVG
jgi:hypothetical protein